VSKYDTGFPSTLRHLLDSGERPWLYCNNCNRSRYLHTVEWVATHNVDIDLPLPRLSRRVRRSRCWVLAVSIRSQPYSNHPRQDERTLRIAANTNRTPCPACGSSDVGRTGPDRRPGDGPRFMPYTLLCEYECEVCGNWWVQPRDTAQRSPINL
jgi:hypothetical protein